MSMAELPFHFNNDPVVIVMGVCGCGKSTIATALAARLKLPVLEGDDFHPQANVDKMSNAIPLNDDDRWPWLDSLGDAIKTNSALHGGVITSCSALKRVYRERLSKAANIPLLFVLLDGDRATLLERMQSREDHYMPTSLLDSQLDILEMPDADEPAITVSINSSIDKIVDDITSNLK